MPLTATPSTAPPPPRGFDPDKFFQGVYWHQRWQIFDGIYTPGVNPVEQMLDALRVPRDLTGKRVLDIGAWNGCVSFECERRGAREVIALGPEDPEQTAFYRTAEAIGSQRVRYQLGSVYDLDPRKLGYFDVIFFCGVLYHLRYPLLGIDNLRRVAVGDVYTETQVLDLDVILGPTGKQRRVPLRNLSADLTQVPIWQFYRFDELNRDSTNWFSPNCVAVVQAFESAGFETRVTSLNGPRATFHSKVRLGPPEWLATVLSGEGFYYDTLVKHLFGDERPGTRP